MPQEPIPALQLDLFVSQSPAYREALDRYEKIRPVLKEDRTLSQQSQETGITYWRLRRYLQRFKRHGIQGLIDRRRLHHPRGKPPAEEALPDHIQQQIVRLAIAHPFSYRELAWIVQDGYGYPIDYRGIQHVLERHQLSPDILAIHRQKARHAPPPPLTASPQMELSLEPTTHAQRLAQALGPEHLLIRFRTYREYPTEEQARWRIIELLDVGFRPRRVARLLDIQPPVVYYWKRRFKQGGVLGLTTRKRAATPITERFPVQVTMEVFQLLDNNPFLGHYRVKMALDSLGYRFGHSTVWQMVAFYKQAHPQPKKEKHTPKPEELPKQAAYAHQVWFVDFRYLVRIDGRWLYSILIFDGYSRAIVGEGCVNRQNFSRLVQVFRQAIAHRGAPEEVVSDNAKVFVALSPCLEKLDVRWSPITKRHPWQNLAEGGFSIQRRMLDAYVVGCTDPETVYRRHEEFVQDYQFWGHWAHKRKDEEGRIFYLSPEVILANAKGSRVDPTYLRRVFRLRQLTRKVRKYGQIRLYNFGLYVDRFLRGQTVDVLIYDDAVRIEQADQLIVSYPCTYNTRRQRITSVDEAGRQQYRRFRVIQLVLFALKIVRWVWRMPAYRRSGRARRVVGMSQLDLFNHFEE